MWHVGIDLHRVTVVMAAVNDAGEAMSPISIRCADTAKAEKGTSLIIGELEGVDDNRQQEHREISDPFSRIPQTSYGIRYCFRAAALRYWLASLLPTNCSLLGSKLSFRLPRR